MTKATYLAAVDLGSNSFRCEIGRLESLDGVQHIVRADYLKETVRLGGGLDKQGRLSNAAIARGLACLERFAERIRGFHPDYVRAVADPA
jgi:exopolyphosphatase / guanosine-5'-triphosphate,3'-diphosphate pyrophosphatase